MLVFNTTFQTDVNEARNFVIWAHEVYIPRALKCEGIKNARLNRILSHKDEKTECFSLQFDVESMANLHKFHISEGKSLSNDLEKIFNVKVVGFSTIMEVIEEC